MRSPASERLRGQKGFGTVHTPLGGRWGHTPRTLSAALGRRRPNPEAKNKGDALALAAGGRPGAVASPAPRRPRRRAPHPCRPAPSAPRNGGRATKWQPRQAKSERRRRNKRRRGPLPPAARQCPPGLPRGGRPGDPSWAPAHLRAPRCRPGLPSPRRPLLESANEAAPLCFQTCPTAGGSHLRVQKPRELSVAQQTGDPCSPRTLPGLARGGSSPFLGSPHPQL